MNSIRYWLLLLTAFGVLAEEHPLWLRYPAISLTGQTIAFEWKGDIYSVPAKGGRAIPLTLSESYEFAPVWSHDGTKLPFASDRYGSFDVFVMDVIEVLTGPALDATFDRRTGELNGSLSGSARFTLLLTDYGSA